MGYMKIKNLYKDKTLMLMKEVYALEKIHGTSAHLAFDHVGIDIFSGGADLGEFKALFDLEALLDKFKMQIKPGWYCTVFGEAYGGKMQRMSDTYGPELRFVAFDVQVGDKWLTVPEADSLCERLGLEFVYWERIPAETKHINAARDDWSQQAYRNGCGMTQKSEGVVLRPLQELRRCDGSRLIAKHKRKDFQERKKQPKLDEVPEIAADAHAVADDWCTTMRLQHVLDKCLAYKAIPEDYDLRHTNVVIKAYEADVQKESEGEVEWSRLVSRAVRAKAAELYKTWVTTMEDLYV